MNQIALISGGSKGIGLASVNVFAKGGFKVIYISRRETKNNMSTMPGKVPTVKKSCNIGHFHALKSYIIARLDEVSPVWGFTPLFLKCSQEVSHHTKI